MGLRERKKLATWRSIRAAALQLFDENGYAATTVEKIAAEANISPATFFNYFSSKEAAIFDPDPEDRANWQNLMHSRAADEALWSSLTGILIEFNGTLRERMLLQRRLSTQSPTLIQSNRNLGELFRSDLHAWVSARAGGDNLDAILQMNLALTASNTAYQTWPAGESFDNYLERVEFCLRRATPTAFE